MFRIRDNDDNKKFFTLKSHIPKVFLLSLYWEGFEAYNYWSYPLLGDLKRESKNMFNSRFLTQAIIEKKTGNL